MLNREMKPIKVISFKTGTDAYGQPRQEQEAERYVDMVCKIYTQSQTDSPLFNNVEMIGITADHTITDKDQLIIDDEKYNVLHTIPSSRYTQVLMQKVV